MIDLRTYSTQGYDSGPLWKRVAWYGISRFFFETRFPWPSVLKANILRVFGANIGNGIVVKPAVKIKTPWLLAVGECSWIGENVWIDNVAEITIGDHVVVSQGAVLMTGNHDYKSRSFELCSKPIHVENYAWICAHSKIAPGVTVGEGAILTFGSIATKSLEARGIYTGNPAQKIREREMDE